MPKQVPTGHPFNRLITDLSQYGQYFSLPKLEDPRYAALPYSIRVLLENAIRCCDDFQITKADVENILNWETASKSQDTEVPFKPSRVLLQDFTGVPAAVDFAALRDVMSRLGGDVDLINPLVPADLVIDHSIQVDVSRNTTALEKNQEMEFERNRERFEFLKWAAKAFQNLLIVPPGSGIVHQVNLEYLARVVFSTDGVLYPDSVVGTDSHTTMIDGLGVVGWGVGGIEAEAVMLGQPISMVLPEVIGFELTGELPVTSTATDLVLTITQMIRERNVVGKFVEFYGEGCKTLTLADRATIANMSPEYGATMGFFPVDAQTLKYLRQSGRPQETVDMVEAYLKAQRMFREYDASDEKIRYSGEPLRLDLATVLSCCSGPKRPHDKVAVVDMARDFRDCLVRKVGFKGFGLTPEDATDTVATFDYRGVTYELKHGAIVIAAITSCTNTSNPSVMLGAGLLAKNAVNAGLSVLPYIKTSLSPGSGVVYQYLTLSGLLPYLEQLGFYMAGFGCQTCIGNSGQLDSEVADAVAEMELVVAAVLSGNRNFEGRVHPLTRANYLMSPMLVVAYAIAGSVTVDLTREPLGVSRHTGKPVFLKDIWPSKESIQEAETAHVTPALFRECYSKLTTGGSQRWQALTVPDSKMCQWSDTSTYIHNPPFFHKTTRHPEPVQDIDFAYCLLLVGDSITTDHISPAGSIARGSPAAQYLEARGVPRLKFNSYGSRRGHDEVMARGTFANVRLVNKLATKVGPFTLHVPSNEEMFIYDAAQRYKDAGNHLIILAGREYGSGSSRDWAAKGPYLLGVRAVIAESYERIHRSNLVGMGILPLEFMPGENVTQLGLNGKETFSIPLKGGQIPVHAIVDVHVTRPTQETFRFRAKVRIDTAVELEYFRHNGILQYVLRKLLEQAESKKA